ncbi:MAG: DUF1800 domain-containing protein [Methylophilaceae bacterium]
MNMSPIAIAVNRFGIGMRLNDQAQFSDVKKWLFSQFDSYQSLPLAWQNQTKTDAIIAEQLDNKLQMRNLADDDKQAARKSMRLEARDHYLSAIQARAESALNTQTPFIERMVHFWSNHFALSVQNPLVTNLAGAFELEAIRPHVLGNFKDLLFAVEKHPAILIYLDQVKSIGPNSTAALRSNARHPEKNRGLNENLAREIMELHTLGVRSGYTQSDVTEFAKVLTGWSITDDNQPKNIKNHKNQMIEGENSFVFRPQIHEPGQRNIMGKYYEDAGLAQGEAVLNDFAISTATAKHIASKLARHFVSDTPPNSLIDKLTHSFLSSHGDLKQLYRTLIEAPESWQREANKFKTPWEWFVSSMRGLGRRDFNGLNVPQILNALGQPTWKPGSPAGYDDIASAWAAPNALLRRVEMAQRFVAPFGDKLDARTLANQLLLGAASTATLTAISRAESASTGLALLLVSPEFLRR